jgi:hypothetical protein
MRVAVAVVDAAFVERLADRAQFVAGREEGHAQRARTGTSAMPSEASRPRSAGRMILPLAQGGAAGLQVFAGAAVVARRMVPA